MSKLCNSRRENPARGHDDGALNEVLQLTDVARPMMTPEDLHDSIGDFIYGLAQPSRELPDELFYEEHNVVLSFP
jgi:hypothetical protein